MSIQTAGNVLVALKRETTTGVAPVTVTGAQQLRITDSPGLQLDRAVIQSAERRDDGLRSMGRLGGKSVAGSYNTELTVGGATDILFEAIMRSTFATAVVIGFATMTTVAIATNEVVAAGGSWITQGVKVGDIFRITGTTVAADNNTNKRVTALTTLTITTATGAFTTLAATVTGTITVLRKVVTATTPTRYTHAVEQYDQDTDLSELFLGCRLTGVRLSLKPGQMATAQYTFQGMDRTALATGTSPFYTSPTLTTDLGLVADDATIRYNGAQVATFTGCDIDFQIAAAGQPVIGSFVSPDIFDNDLTVTGTITGLRSDFSNLTLYDAETEFGLGILLEELETAPKDCLSFWFPRVKISGLSAPVGGGDGAKIETLQLMIGPLAATTTSDGSICTIQTSETA